MNKIVRYAILQQNGLYNIEYRIYKEHCDNIIESGIEREDVKEEDLERELDDLSYDSDRHYDDDALTKFKEYENDSRANSE